MKSNQLCFLACYSTFNSRRGVIVYIIYIHTHIYVVMANCLISSDGADVFVFLAHAKYTETVVMQ